MYVIHSSVCLPCDSTVDDALLISEQLCKISIILGVAETAIIVKGEFILGFLTSMYVCKIIKYNYPIVTVESPVVREI